MSIHRRFLYVCLHFPGTNDQERHVGSHGDLHYFLNCTTEVKEKKFQVQSRHKGEVLFRGLGSMDLVDPDPKILDANEGKNQISSVREMVRRIHTEGMIFPPN